MLTELKKDQLSCLPVDPYMFNNEDWDDLERHLVCILREDKIAPSTQELPPILIPSKKDDHV